MAFPVKNRSEIQLSGVPFNNGFELKLSEFDDVLADREVGSAMVLVSSWALFESHCLEILDELRAQDPNFQWSGEYPGAVEVWAPRLLALRYRAWGEVLGGKESIIEAATLRNALAHGETVISETMMNRLNNSDGEWSQGLSINITFNKCEALRASLKSYARIVEGKDRLQ